MAEHWGSLPNLYFETPNDFFLSISRAYPRISYRSNLHFFSGFRGCISKAPLRCILWLASFRVSFKSILSKIRIFQVFIEQSGGASARFYMREHPLSKDTSDDIAWQASFLVSIQSIVSRERIHILPRSANSTRAGSIHLFFSIASVRLTRSLQSPSGSGLSTAYVSRRYTQIVNMPLHPDRSQLMRGSRDYAEINQIDDACTLVLAIHTDSRIGCSLGSFSRR